MKTDRISLFILAIEIVLITALHSAKETPAELSASAAKQNSFKSVPSHTSISFIGLTR